MLSCTLSPRKFNSLMGKVSKNRKCLFHFLLDRPRNANRSRSKGMILHFVYCNPLQAPTGRFCSAERRAVLALAKGCKFFPHHQLTLCNGPLEARCNGARSWIFKPRGRHVTVGKAACMCVWACVTIVGDPFPLYSPPPNARHRVCRCAMYWSLPQIEAF